MYPNALTQGCATCGPYVVSDVKFVGPKCQIYHLHHNKIDLQKKKVPTSKISKFRGECCFKNIDPSKTGFDRYHPLLQSLYLHEQVREIFKSEIGRPA